MRMQSDHSAVSTLVTENAKAPVHTYEDMSNVKDTEKERRLNKETELFHTSLEANSGCGANGSNLISGNTVATVDNTAYDCVEKSNIKDTEEERRLSKPHFSWHDPCPSPEDKSGSGGGGEKTDMV